MLAIARERVICRSLRAAWSDARADPPPRRSSSFLERLASGMTRRIDRLASNGLFRPQRRWMA